MSELEEFAVRIKDLNQGDQSIVCQELAVFCISVLRGIHGNQFIIEFLYAAMNDDLGLVPSKDSN